MHKHVLIAALASIVGIGPALAKDIGIPAEKPRVALQIPDDWTVTFDEAGLQAVSPETNSFVYAKIMKRPKDDPNAWVKDVLAKLQARGVTFKTGKETVAPPVAVAAPKPAVPVLTGSNAPVPPLLPPAPTTASIQPLAPADAKALPAPAADLKPVVPAVDPKATAPAADLKPVAPVEDKKPAVVAASAPAALEPPPLKLTVPSMALLNEGPRIAASTPKAPAFPRHALPYKDTVLNGTPVDVELLTFNLPDKSVFFLLQESGKTDPRIADIIASVKPPQ